MIHEPIGILSGGIAFETPHDEERLEVPELYPDPLPVWRGDMAEGAVGMDVQAPSLEHSTIEIVCHDTHTLPRGVGGLRRMVGAGQ